MGTTRDVARMEGGVEGRGVGGLARRRSREVMAWRAAEVRGSLLFPRQSHMHQTSSTVLVGFISIPWRGCELVWEPTHALDFDEVPSTVVKGLQLSRRCTRSSLSHRAAIPHMLHVHASVMSCCLVTKTHRGSFSNGAAMSSM